MTDDNINDEVARLAAGRGLADLLAFRQQLDARICDMEEAERADLSARAAALGLEVKAKGRRGRKPRAQKPEAGE